MVCDWLRRGGWRDVHHNMECLGVQIDILARSPMGVLTLVEVKSDGPRALAHLPWRQAWRLKRVAEFLAELEAVEIALALVADGKVEWVPVDALTDF